MRTATNYKLKATKGIAAVAWLSATIAISAQQPIDLSSFLEHGNPWGQKATVFMRSVNQPNAVRSFDWVTSDARNEARYPKWANSPEVKLWDLTVWEGLARFNNDALTQLKVSLYTRGDAEARNDPSALVHGWDSIAKLLRTTNDRLVQWCGSQGRDIQNNEVKVRGAQTDGKLFIKGNETRVRMIWSYSGRRRDDFVLEYLTLIFEPLTRANDPRIPSLRKPAVQEVRRPTARGLAANVTHTAQGDVYIDGFPMVDQGAKGYCAVATAERILRYYGSEVDQHVLAQLAASSGQRGTSMEALYEALRKAGSQLGVSVRDLMGFGLNINEWKKLANDYNRQARRERKPKVEDKQWITVGRGVVTYNFSALIDAFDWEVFTNYKREREEYKFKRFRKHIKENIDVGIPLVWSVVLGKVPEPQLAQARGGHMRTIIGYNARNDEIIYSDSWGPGHEFKKMDTLTAFTITIRLDLLAPRLQH